MTDWRLGRLAWHPRLSGLRRAGDRRDSDSEYRFYLVGYDFHFLGGEIL